MKRENSCKYMYTVQYIAELWLVTSVCLLAPLIACKLSSSYHSGMYDSIYPSTIMKLSIVFNKQILYMIFS